MVMPLPSHLRLPSPTAPRGVAHHPRSPVKKHLRDHVPTKTAKAKPVATSTHAVKIGSPQKLKATVASSQRAVAADPPSSGSVTSRLRAATLQAVLGLVDRDDAALQQLLPMLRALASLPLDNASAWRECGAFLQELVHTYATDSDSVPTAHTSPARAESSSRDSGRAKSSVSLRHCKDFLLACANEIHELEDVDPCFDYAEETSSEPLPVMAPRRRVGPSALAAFDYASLADAESSMGTGDSYDQDQDDVRADTGSQFSELLLRTVEAERDDREATAAVFHAWRAATVSAARGRLVRPVRHRMLQQSFAALKRHRAASTLSQQRKRQAFARLKALVAASPMAVSPPAVAVHTPPSTATRVVARLLLHWDLVVLLAVAFAVQLSRLS